MENVSLKDKFTKLARKYTLNFLELYFYGDEPEQLPEFWWVGDEIGGMLVVNDYYFSFDEVRLCVDKNIPENELFEWYEYCNRVMVLDLRLPLPNLDSWVRGCPRISNDELLKKENEKRSLAELNKKFEKDIEDLMEEVVKDTIGVKSSPKKVYFNGVGEDANI